MSEAIDVDEDTSPDLQAEQILAGLRAGREDVMRECIDAYGPGLARFVKRRLRIDSAVIDVLQETWLTLFRKHHGIKDADQLKGWLYRVASRHGLRSVTGPRDPARMLEMPEDWESRLRAHTTAVTRAAEASQTLGRVYELIDGMPDKQREMLRLVSEGLDSRAIFDVLEPGGSYQAFRTALSRARAMLAGRAKDLGLDV